MSKPEKPELKIMLLGKTGVGKTSSMNTLMGRDPVKYPPSPCADTPECKRETREFDDFNLVIIDTPGTFHTEKTEADVEKSLMEAIVLAAPGVDMFLLVTTYREEGQEDEDSWKSFQEMFGENTKDYTLALFTKGDIERLSQENFDRRHIKRFSVDWHTFDNTKKNTIPDQVPELLKKINSIVQNREEKKKMYTNEMFQQAQKIKEEMRKKMREEQEKQGKKTEADEEGILKAFLSQFAGETNCHAMFTFVKLIQNKAKKLCKTE